MTLRPCIFRFRIALLAASLLWLGTMDVAAQTKPAATATPAPTMRPAGRQGPEQMPVTDPTAPLIDSRSPRRTPASSRDGFDVERQQGGGGGGQRSEFLDQPYEFRRPIVRVFRDFTLKEGDVVREIVGVFGNVRIEGHVDGDVVITGGAVTLTRTAAIDGSLVAVGGNVKVEPGASVRHSLVVIGGALDAPPDFSPRYEQVIVGTPEIGDSIQALVPWFKRGLLWGRLLVPDLRWNWTIVFVSFLIGLVFNHVFARQVGACAEVIGRRPVSAFLMGLLALFLAPILLTIVAASVIGLVVVPFAIAAFIAAGMIGKVGVSRAIGRSVISEPEPDNRLQSARSFVLGAVIITLAYMVPILGLMTWAVIGVFGIGAATMSLAARLKRERPVAPPVAPPVTPVDLPPTPPPYVAPGPSVSYASSAAISAEPPPYQSAAEITPDVPPVDHVPPSAPAPPPVIGGLAMYPRAGFFDRVAAMALDIVLIAIANNFLDQMWRGRDGAPFLFMVLAYHIGFWAWKGTTLGGIICNLRVIRTTGEDPRFIDAFVRGLSSIFSVVALGIGCFWMINDAERQMWHDKIAGTVVVKLPRELVLA